MKKINTKKIKTLERKTALQVFADWLAIVEGVEKYNVSHSDTAFVIRRIKKVSKHYKVRRYNMEEENNKLRIEHLEQLLKGRKGEYDIFGATSEDIEQDNKIRAEIKLLSDTSTT